MRSWPKIGLFVGLIVAPALAQLPPTAAPGFRAEGVFDFAGGVDQVSLFNGALTAQIPLGPPIVVGGPGPLSYQPMASYASSSWEAYPQFCGGEVCNPVIYPKPTSRAGLGWRLSFGDLHRPAGSGANYSPRFLYVDPTGTEHVLYDDLHPSLASADLWADDEKLGEEPEVALAPVSYVRDGAYLRLSCTPTTFAICDLEFGSGERHRFENIGTPTAPKFHLTKIYDRYGNFIQIDYSANATGNLWTISDSGHAGRSTKVQFFSPGASYPNQPELVDFVETPCVNNSCAPGETHAKWDFSYQSRNIWHPGVFNNSETSAVPTMLLKEILLPDGSSFSMPVAAAGSVNAYGGPAGELTKLLLPTLGHFEWSWGSSSYPEIRGYTGCPQQLPPDSNNWNSFSGVTSRREYDIGDALLGETTYSRTPNVADSNPTPAEYVTVRVESPIHDVSLHYFSIWPGFAAACATSAWGTTLAEYAMPYMRDPELDDTLDEEDPGSDVQRYLSSVHYDCPGGANPDLATCSKKRTVYQAWEIDEPDGAPWENGGVADRNRRLLSERTFYNDDTSGGVRWKLRRMSDFDGLGHYRISVSKANFITGHDRTQTTDWNPGRGTFPGTYDPIETNEDWIFEFYDFRLLEEDDVPRLGASTFTQIAREEFCFDNSGGFVQRHRRVAADGGAHAVGDTMLVRTADAKGNLINEEWFGGDGSSLPEACTETPPTAGRYRMAHTVNGAGVRTSSQWKDGSGNATNDLNFYAMKRTIDPYTGWVTASEDVAGLQTTFVYDKMGRLKEVHPQASGGSGDAWETYEYSVASSFSSPARVRHRAYTCCDSTTTPLIDEEWHYDGIGRLRRERRLDAETANTFNDRYTCYDAAGNRSFLSEWDRGEPSSGTACKSWINSGLEWSGFDPFGRAAKVSRYSSGILQFDEAELTYVGERKVTRKQWMATTLVGGVPTDTAVERIEWFDDHGRLQSVNEASDPSSSAYVATDYSYDVGNRLRRSTTQQDFCPPNPECNPAPSNQIRWSLFDQLGFLRRERSPERGSGGNGSIYLYDYDPLGNAHSKQDGDAAEGVILSFDFDRASRLTKVTDVTNGHVLKEFEYNSDGGSSSSDYRRGKLTVATAHNWMDLGVATYEAQFREAFVYGGVGGRRSKRTVKFSFGPEGGAQGDNETFYHSEQFDSLGRRTRVVYPTCDALTPDCNFSPPARTVDSSYSEGFLRSVSEGTFDWISDITYHKSGLWNVVTQGNMNNTDPVKTTQTQDVLKIARPAKIESKVGLTTLWRSGTYAYDRSGNVRQILGNEEGGNDQFLYDQVGRLVRAELDVPDVTGSFRDSMIFNDGFESSTASRWVETWPPVSHPASSVQTFSYDRFGNLLTMPIDGTGSSLTTSLATNHLSSGTYDGRGNLHTYSSNTYSFDNLNRLQKETKGSGESRYFLYTADDERILTYDPNLPSVFHFALRDFNGKVLRTFDRILPDPLHPETQYSAAGRDYIHAGDRVIGTEDPKQPGSTRMWATLDHLGTPRMWTGPNGEVLRRHKYYPYGEEMTPSDQWNVALQFTGHERDAQNLGGPADDGDNMHARFHSPLTGRFLSVDPVLSGRALKRPQAWNRYNYVIGNPLKYIDPSGQLWFKVSGKWTFKEGVDQIEEESTDDNGNTTVTITAGRATFVGFDGSAVTLYGKDGTTHSWAAVSGDVKGGKTQPGLQSVRDRGPIPEGMYSFNPALVQNYDRHVNTLDKLAGLVGRGGWRGGQASWGNNRAELSPYSSTNTYGRSGFYIHGGQTPGSRGCIDLCSQADDFFSAVGSEPGSLDVEVDYP